MHTSVWITMDTLVFNVEVKILLVESQPKIQQLQECEYFCDKLLVSIQYFEVILFIIVWIGYLEMSKDMIT